MRSELDKFNRRLHVGPVAAKLICLTGYKVELSKFNSSRRAVGMCEITALGDFQGLWEERETALCFPLFPSGRHFHRPQFVAREFHRRSCVREAPYTDTEALNRPCLDVQLQMAEGMRGRAMDTDVLGRSGHTPQDM